MKIYVRDLKHAEKWVAVGIGCLGVLILLALVCRPILHSLFRHRASHGAVEAINYIAAHNESYLQPIPHVNCQPQSNGKTTTTVCTTTYTYIPMTRHVSDEWDVRVKDETGTEDWVSVSEEVYHSCQVGLYYPGDGQLCTEAIAG